MSALTKGLEWQEIIVKNDLQNFAKWNGAMPRNFFLVSDVIYFTILLVNKPSY